jgi:VanZ family protein
MKQLFRAGLAAHLTLVVAISIGAYTGLLPTSIRAVRHLDKLGHALLIGGLGFFLDGVLEHRRLWRTPSLAAVIILTVAGVEEYLQRFSSRRSSDIMDFAADAVGVCFFVWLSRRLDQAAEARLAAPPAG